MDALELRSLISSIPELAMKEQELEEQYIAQFEEALFERQYGDSLSREY